MPKRDDETFAQYRHRVIDSISPSFCAAKWLNATIWLTCGQTTSCHHPPAHDTKLDEVIENPSALHNTLRKRFDRQFMLAGKRPKGCEYCWKMENLGDAEIISDRVFKTAIYTDEEIMALTTGDPFEEDVNLKTLEVSFNSTCNFNCCYCNAGFSSKWAEDINKHGLYEELEHLDRDTLNHNGERYNTFKDDDQNPYIAAFWKWWPLLFKTLQDFRVTGGEPLLSRQLWKLFDYFEERGSGEMSFSVNSNLSVPDKLIDKFIKKSYFVKDLHLYTSCEAIGTEAEYIRDGMDYSKFIQNCRKVIEKGNIKSLNMMMTVNLLCLYSITDFMDAMIKLKREYGVQFPVWTVNILRFPCFLSVLALPRHIREERQVHLSRWLLQNREKVYVSDFEIDGIYRLIQCLKSEDKVHANSPDDETVMHRDLKRFLTQYDQRRGKSFKKIFPNDFTDWVESIEL